MRVVGDIAGDAVKIFALTRNTAEGDTSVSRWQFQTSYPYFPPGITHYGWNSAGKVFAQAGGGGAARVNVPAATALRDYQLHGGYTPGPVFGFGLLAGIAGIFTVRRRRDAGLALACLLLTGSALRCRAESRRRCAPCRWGPSRGFPTADSACALPAKSGRNETENS